MENKKPKTQPRLVVPQESPSPDPSEGTRISEAPIANMASAALVRRGVPAPVADELSSDLATVFGKAAAKVPSWVIYLAVTFGAPALYAFYETWKSVEALPPRVAVIEGEVKEVRDELREIKALLQGPTSRPRY